MASEAKHGVVDVADSSRAELGQQMSMQRWRTTSCNPFICNEEVD